MPERLKKWWSSVNAKKDLARFREQLVALDWVAGCGLGDVEGRAGIIVMMSGENSDTEQKVSSILAGVPYRIIITGGYTICSRD